MVSWTAATALQSAALFFVAGLGEIGGGWLVWQTVREKKPWWWAVLGGFALVGCKLRVASTLPTESFECR